MIVHKCACCDGCGCRIWNEHLAADPDWCKDCGDLQTIIVDDESGDILTDE